MIIITSRAANVKGNTAQRLCGRCAVDFFVRLYKNDAGVLCAVLPKEFQENALDER
ncbi:MAG: hypothetical protein J6K77_01625 [Ruminococcus sp.]|nr:hypothetical protein [Ruminococcus sp.]